MLAKRLTPFLNVSSLQASFAWFETLGWSKGWEWGDPPGFGGVHSGECEIFLCEDGQGGRGRGHVAMTFGPTGNERSDKGSWMSVWVDDVDAVHARCQAEGLEITWPPTDMPWGVREMHVRHRMDTYSGSARGSSECVPEDQPRALNALATREGP